MRVGLAADHGGFALKQALLATLTDWGHEVRDFGAAAFDPADDYPDFVIPLARAVAVGEVERGVVVCGSGVGACVAVNKIAGVRAALITDTYSAHQGVEDDDMNVICLGGRVIGEALARELVAAFLAARYKALSRHERRLAKVRSLEAQGGDPSRPG
ncbi:MAG: RpiB/LacA/LacB family sugar-phosphate isomerase [Armatimonadota bacterium]